MNQPESTHLEDVKGFLELCVNNEEMLNAFSHLLNGTGDLTEIETKFNNYVIGE